MSENFNAEEMFPLCHDLVRTRLKTNWTAVFPRHLDDTEQAAWRHVLFPFVVYAR